MGCTDDAQPIADVVANDPDATQPPEADLYYSWTCEAVWVEYDTTDPFAGQVVRINTVPDYGGVQETAVEVDIDHGTGDYVSTMVSWDSSVDVCVELYGGCSGWR